MSSDHHVLDNPEIDKEWPKGCPHCGANGPFDGQAGFVRKGITSGYRGEREYVEHWSRHRCPDCGEVFGTRERRIEASQEDSDAGVDG
jgi:ribosomal protein S27AE